MVATTGVEPVSLGWEPSVLTTWLSRHLNRWGLFSYERSYLSTRAAQVTTPISWSSYSVLSISGKESPTLTCQVKRGEQQFPTDWRYSASTYFKTRCLAADLIFTSCRSRRLVGVMGLEPTPYWLRVSCSANWASHRFSREFLRHSLKLFYIYYNIIFKVCQDLSLFNFQSPCRRHMQKGHQVRRRNHSQHRCSEP